MEISVRPEAGELPQKTVPPQNGTTSQHRERDTPVPATKLWTTDRSEPVKLRMGTGKGPDTFPPITVPTAFERTVQKMPNQPALGVKRDGQWKKWTYQQYYTDVQRAAKSFIKLGLQPFHGVGILGFNAPEWHISYLASIYAGGLGTGIYATNTAEACQYVLEDSESNIVVVENNAQLQKILAVWDKLPHLKAIIQYTGEVAVRKENIYTWDEFMKLSNDVPNSVVNERLSNLAPNHCCTLIYTSGTTGNPKGVMQSHDSLTFLCVNGMAVYKLKIGEEVIVSYLPLSHSAGLMMDIHMPYFIGAMVYFAQPDALKGTLKNTLVECRPTMFLGVPRVWEKFAEKMQEAARSVTGIKRTIGVKAKKIGLKGVYASMRHEHKPRGWTVAQAFLFNKVKKSLGLDRCHLHVTGAAPITKETIEYFYCFNINIISVYGMSECGGPHTSETPEKFKIGSVGCEIPGVTTKLAETETPERDGSGEVCMWGRNLFMGYLNNDEKTKEAIDDEGWLRSGDIGKKDDNGFLYITGRIKELLITAGGENIAPVPVEDNVKEELPVVSNCMLIGDKMKFLSMLITLKVEVDIETGEPTDQLTPEVQDWCKSFDCNYTTLSEVLEQRNPQLFKAIQTGIDKANNRAVSRATKVQKWSILPRDFSIPGGELGPTLKLRRPIVVKMYDKTIKAFYADT
ncbi:long-chain-fatty-acid--CoA ligase ACSBG2-like [Mizuhopecten yessoensis]|uniref:long-chain-fatty-acid--CoA ligase ACSBG2-like n=1 Tax=Mizuhopecten yessoensis TaxID=6573 RepID=UPI000B459C21|nr:long-chain-fatty-acid--CoA ligase ACSBG2-like [Mizuhopecten yessoensis]XP_021368612.1 long-chain-fatty-acid--CoA ligase ACSBG2-like [Mizuhopecten yessoensis]XP_021368614.1 long-chain-fatty-acid--CoA ligase ACSBG2-like [Mizuhopecten yessoensis]XP_021368615.1 long-chain-fatty-acid--CoA ligase ACSBG2-like [Mizuhopecten yessoensis]